MKKYFFIIILFFCSCNQADKVESIEKFDSLSMSHRPYFVYPSVLRALNTGDIPEYNEMIKEMDKVIYRRLRSEKFGVNDYYQTISDLKEKDGYEEMLTIDGKGQRVYLLGDADAQHAIVLAHVNSQYHLAELHGQIDLLPLPQLIRKINSGDTTVNNVFLDLIKDFAQEQERISNREEDDFEEMEGDTLESFIEVDSIEIE